MTLNLILISLVEQDFFYFHECEVRVIILESLVSQVKLIPYTYNHVFNVNSLNFLFITFLLFSICFFQNLDEYMTWRHNILLFSQCYLEITSCENITFIYWIKPGVSRMNIYTLGTLFRNNDEISSCFKPSKKYLSPWKHSL